MRTGIQALTFALLVILPVTSGDEPPSDESFPSFPPKSTTEALATFKIRDGFHLELLAAEPLVMDPVAAAYDEDGQLYVVEMSDYPYTDPKNDKPFTENTLDPPLGRVRLLIDRDGDGHFDEGHLFAEKLSWPTGIAVWKGGVFVGATPDLWYFKDTDGDGEADVRQKVFTGFRKFNVQAVMNNLTWGLDHQIYGAASGNGGLVVPADQPDAKPVNVLRRDFRFDPRTKSLQAISGGARFGNTFDDHGNRFLCNIRNPAEHVVLPSHYLERNPLLPAPPVLHDAAESGDTIPVYRISPPEPWREVRARRWAAIGKAYPQSELVGAGFLTSSSGVTVYRGDAYPDSFRGNLFLGEVANNLIIRFAVEPDGVTFRARRAEPDGVEFLASTDTWFRPVNFVNAPDGTLHILDMYRETIEHPWSIPDDILSRLDLRSGTDRGRIYRLEPPDFERRPTPRLSQALTTELVALLEHPNAWHRDTAHRLIFERQDDSAVAPLRRLLDESDQPLARLHTLWSLDGLDKLTDGDLLHALNDTSATVREHAVRLAEPRLPRSPALLDRVLKLAGSEDDARVRFQLAFTLGEVTDPSADFRLAAIALRDADDLFIRTAVLSSAYRDPLTLLQTLLDRADRPFLDRPGALALLRSLAFQVGARGKIQEAVATLATLAKVPKTDGNGGALARKVVLTLAEGLGRSKSGLTAVSEEASGNEQAHRFLEDILESARRDVANPVASVEAVSDALALLADRPFAEAKEWIAPRLEPTQPQEIQQAAARALATHAEPEVAKLLLTNYRAYRPALKADILQILLGRPIWQGALLDAVASGQVPPGQIPTARRGLLLESRNPAIRDRARSLLGAEVPGPRREVIARYQEALTLSALAERGRAVFERECLTCHKLGEKGHSVGPNLASVQRRGPDEILLHILDPNREVAPDFLEYVVELKDGRVATGLIASETATSLTLKRAEGESETILRREVEAIASTGKSLMPEGLEDKLKPQEMADLLAFLLEIQK